MSKSFSNYKYKNGFTLLEMIVSLGIFSIIAVIAVGSLVRITSLNRQAQSLQSAMNNMNYILESMSREMRFGSKFKCLTSDNLTSLVSINEDCDNTTQNVKGLAFESSRTALASDGNLCNLINVYWFTNIPNIPNFPKSFDIKKSQQTSCGQKVKESDALSLIDKGNVTLTNVYFSVTANYSYYSLASIKLTGNSGKKSNEINNFEIRTMVSQRSID